MGTTRRQTTEYRPLFPPRVREILDEATFAKAADALIGLPLEDRLRCLVCRLASAPSLTPYPRVGDGPLQRAVDEWACVDFFLDPDDVLHLVRLSLTGGA